MHRSVAMKESISPPKSLKDLQYWFASIITRRMNNGSEILAQSPSGRPISDEAAFWINPSKTLAPFQRIEIYNQQYWWRLLTIMQENFPVLTRIFGYSDFNNLLAEPFLLAYPPNHWSLNNLGDYFPEWIQKNYHDKDKRFVYESACLDLAFNLSFVEKELAPINFIEATQEGAEGLLTQKIRLQPHLFILEFKYSLPQFREAILKHPPEHWVDHDFPELKKGKRVFVVFRSKEMNVVWKEISYGAFFLLKQFEKGSSIENVCSWLENQEGPLLEEAKENLHFWFQEWTILGWLGLEASQKLSRN